ncbi:MAG: hypothetical protein R3C19_06385 [Planctomycetaceae bacterium]
MMAISFTTPAERAAFLASELIVSLIRHGMLFFRHNDYTNFVESLQRSSLRRAVAVPLQELHAIV